MLEGGWRVIEVGGLCYSTGQKQLGCVMIRWYNHPTISLAEVDFFCAPQGFSCCESPWLDNSVGRY